MNNKMVSRNWPIQIGNQTKISGPKVVDTTQLIKDNREIFTTHRTACMVANDELTSLAASSPNNILHKIYSEKTYLPDYLLEERTIMGGSRCIMPRTLKLVRLLESDGIYLVIEQGLGSLVLASSFLAGNTVKRLWVNGKNLYAYPKVSSNWSIQTLDFKVESKLLSTLALQVIYYSLRQKGNERRIGGL